MCVEVEHGACVSFVEKMKTENRKRRVVRVVMCSSKVFNYSPSRRVDGVEGVVRVCFSSLLRFAK